METQETVTISRESCKRHEKEMKHIQNVLDTCKRLGCTPSELLKRNYMTELGYDKS